MSARYIFVDLETTGLEPSRDEIWDAAWIFDDNGSVIERQFFVAHRVMPSSWTLANTAYEKTWLAPLESDEARAARLLPSNMAHVAKQLAIDAVRLAGPLYEHDVYFVGACPAFDFSFLRRHFNDTARPARLRSRMKCNAPHFIL